MIITRIWDRQPGEYFFISTKKGRGTWHDEPFHRKDLHKVAAYIERHRDCDVYFSPQGFIKPQRHKDYAIQPKLLWSDMDGVDPRKCKWQPTVAFESSPGRHVGLWLLDDQMTEGLNQRLTYAIGADVSGWDFTQVLRVPGTINYKYASLPRTRIMWSDGPTYDRDKLTDELPKLQSKASTLDASDASSVYRKWEKKLPPWLRRELSSKKEPKEGSRSEMVMKMSHTMHERGMSREEGLTLIAASVWNKYKGRRDEVRQLNRTWDKAINKSMSGERVRTLAEDDHDYPWIGKSLAETEEENLDWLWYPYLARGQLTIIEGDPGLGKSYLAQVIAGHVMDGRMLPSARKKIKLAPSKVIYFDLENSAGSVTKKRIKWNGFERHDNFYQEERPFSIDDVDTMEAIGERLGKLKPAIVFFDTLNTYIGKADAFKGHEVQQAMLGFRALAQQFNCSVVLVRHLTKGSRDQQLLYRGQGSMAIIGMARLAIQVGRMPDDDETKVFGMIKNNFGPPPPPMTFTVDALPDTLKEWDRSKFVWGDWQKGKTLSQILTAKPEDAGNALDDAKDFVRDQLANGNSITDDELKSAAESASISAKVLSRALDALGAVLKSGSWKLG